MRWVIGGVVAIVLVVLIGTHTIGSQDPQENLHSRFDALMRMKLERSQGILEGLTLEDFELIGKNARALELLSRESGWNILQTEEYKAQSDDFRRATEWIASAAKDKDISRATLGYVTLTVRCVECHSYIRKMPGVEEPVEQP